MPVIAFEIIGDKEDEITAKKFMLESEERLTKNPIMKGNIRGYGFKFYVVDMNILTPPFYHYSLITVVAGLIFNISWLWIISLAFWCIGLFFWECPLVTMIGLRSGLKKTGYHGKIKMISLRETVRRIISYGRG